MDSGSKAVFAGVTLETTGRDIYKAIMEGVTYEMLFNLKRLACAGITPSRLYATGGGAMSTVWLQIKANILGLPITSLSAPEIGVVGTVILTGIAVGGFENLNAAKAVMAKEGKTYYPDMEKHKKYIERINAMKKFIDAVRPLL